MCTQPATQISPRAQADALAEELRSRNLEATVLATRSHQRHPCIRVTNPALARMSEDIYVAPIEGIYYFWWSWMDTICQTTYVQKAADIIAHVLQAEGH
jgi:hypothetical protein